MPTPADIQTAAQMVQRSERVVVLTGAGISTDSGIPDYRGPAGLWTKDPGAEKLSSLQHYLADKDVRRRAWRARSSHAAWDARPNAGHRALVELERGGRLHLLITQNIDGLHQQAGHDPARVVEIHGTLREVVCMACGVRGPMQDTLQRVRNGEEDPDCLECGGILKSATISFGQSLVAADLRRAEQAAKECDLMLAVGSTLGVYPIAAVVPLAKRAGARVLIVNGGQTELDGLADLVLHAQISDVLPKIVAAD